MDETQETREKLIALRKEREALAGRVEEMRAELGRIDAQVFEADQYMAAFPEREAQGLERISRLEARKTSSIDAINTLRRRLKDIQSDEASSRILDQALCSDLADLGNERATVLRNLQEIKDSLRRIESNAAQIKPYGKQQDDMLKKAYLLLKEAQDRMELSMAIKKCEETI